MPANSIFDGPASNSFSVLCMLIEILSCAHEKGGKGLKTISDLALLLLVLRLTGRHGKEKVNKYDRLVEIPACPSLVCFFNRGSTEGTNS